MCVHLVGEFKVKLWAHVEQWQCTPRSTKLLQIRARLQGCVKPALCYRATKQQQQHWASPAGCCLGTRMYRWGSDGQLRWPNFESRQQLTLEPVLQEKVYKEQQEIFGDSQRLPTYRCIQQMKYLEMVIKETLRLYPTVPLFGRKMSKDFDVGESNVLLFDHTIVCVCVCVCKKFIGSILWLLP